VPRAFAWDRAALSEAGSHLAVRVGESFLERSELLLDCGKLRTCGLELGASPIVLRASFVSFGTHALTRLSACRPLVALRPGGLPA
jgi:hypothetical protein